MGAHTAPMSQRPNILLTMTDTQPTEFLGCYAGAERFTPQLDALAADGTRFERCHTTCPLCTPARAALFTGMSPSRAGAYTNSQPLGDTIRTMGQLFTDAGYRAAYIGKWHLDGHDYFGDGDCPAGWEDAYWYDGKRYLLDLSPEQVDLWRRWPNTVEACHEHDVGGAFPTWAQKIGDRAERFLAEQHDERPYLLVCSYDEPHHPFTAPAEFIERCADLELPLGPSAWDDLSGKPAHQREWQQSMFGVQDEPNGIYNHTAMLACNSHVDDQIGRVVAAARDLSARTGRPTWIVHTSDHGDHCGTHRIRNKGPTGYDWNTRIPLIVVPPPGHDGAGAAVQPSVAGLLDILPTLLEVAGISAPDSLDGTSLLPLLGHDQRDDQRHAFIEYTRYEVAHDGFGGFEPLRCLVRWPFKLVVNLFQTDELYRLDEDPDELHNRIDDPAYADDRDRMHLELLAWMDEHVDPWRGQPWERRPWHNLQLDRWKAPQRPIRNTGRKPPYFDYDSGKPTRGVSIQYE